MAIDRKIKPVEESKINFGVLVSISNIVELHFITIEFT